MQFDLPFVVAATEVRLRGGDDDPASARQARDPVAPDQIDFVRVQRARRYILRVRPDGGLRVTIPRGGSRAEALQFVDRQAAWIARQRARLQTEHRSRAWADGTTILLAGRPVVIRLEQDGPTRFASYADRRVSVPPDVSDVRPFIERDLRALAQATLAGRVHALARRHSLTVARVTIRDQRSRWGSCSKDGRVALNFRLIQMPSDVCDYVIVHELMHLRQQNHSIRFWRLVERACPAFRDAERWLRTEGRWLL